MWPGAILGLLIVACPAIGNAQSFSAQTVQQGRYLAIAGDCAACHTAPGGRPFAGGYAIASPLGVIYSTNITPSRASGIGRYSEAQFAAALRKGVRSDRAHLYPAMPYTAYARLNDTDVHALYAYFMQGVHPVDTIAPKTRLPFPFNFRFSMAFWNALFFKDGRFAPDPQRSQVWNRGAYLVGALEHCSTCHTARGFLMQEKNNRAYGGAALGAWFAPNITSDAVSGVGAWSQGELVNYLRDGRAVGKGQAAGAMGEAVSHSLSRLTDADLQAIVTYLKTISPLGNSKNERAAFAWGRTAESESELRGSGAKPPLDGRSLYSGLCASCHGPAGGGVPGQAYPSLFHNSAVGAPNPDNVIAVILNGVDRDASGQRAVMPSFGANSFVQPLSDAQVARVANFVRTTFGPGRADVSLSDVATARRGGRPSVLLPLARIGMVVAFIVFCALLLTAGAYLTFRPRRSGLS